MWKQHGYTTKKEVKMQKYDNDQINTCKANKKKKGTRQDTKYTPAT
jgi:hypothetical protein